MKNNLRKMKISRFICLSLSLLLFCGGCVNNQPADDDGASDVLIWSAQNTEKILADTDYGERMSEDFVVSISAAKNEWETCQIIITPDEDVKQFFVEISDLQNGENIISKDNVDIFAQKYVAVTTSTSINNLYPKGEYPDGLVPFDQYCANHENFIEKTKNQGITFDIYVPETAVAGDYRGNITVTIDGEKNTVPVSLHVYDFAVPDATYAKTAFGIYDYMLTIHDSVTDRNSQNQMVEKYYDFLLSYKINGQQVPYAYVENRTDDEYINGYVDALYEARQDPRVQFTSLQILYNGDGSINTTFLARLLTAIVKKSTDEVNILDICYLYAADEPQLNNSIGLLMQRGSVLQEIKKELVSELDMENAFFGKYEVRDALLDLPVLSTVPLGYDLEGIVDCYVPLFNAFNSAESRYEQSLLQGSGDEFWWYGCVGPTAPYPSYHIDDSLISARTLSYMQMYYNVEGNLYWATNVYRKYSAEQQEYVELTQDELWEEAMLYPGANGDGRLLYPGDKYGIDGPLPTVRLLAIRDANEDYDYLYMINEILREMNERFNTDVTIQELLHIQYSALFKDVKPVIDSDLFASSRDYFARLLEALNDIPHLVKVENIDAVTKKAQVAIYAPEGTSLTVDGKQIASTKTNGGNKFVFETDTVKETMRICLTDRDGQAEFEYDVFGEVCTVTGFENFDAEWLTVSQYGGEADMVAEIVNDEECVSEGENSLKITLKPVHDEYSLSYFQVCTINFGNVSIQDFSQAKEFVFTLINPGDQTLKINLRLKDDGNNNAPQGYVMVAPHSSETYTLALSFPSGFNMRNIQYLEIYSDRNTGDRDIDFYVDDVYVVY